MRSSIDEIRPSALTGILLYVLATACFAVLDTSVKVASTTVPVMVAVWFRYMFQAVAVTTLFLPSRGTQLLKTQHRCAHILRGTLLFLVSALSFVAVQHMPVGEFTAIVMITPLMVTLLAAVFLREKVPATRWWLVAGGFAGALLVVRPGQALLGWASLIPLLMVVIYAWFQILTSKMARTENAMTLHFYTGWSGALLASAVLPFVWQDLPGWGTLALLCLIGLMGTVGHFLLILAFARAPASTLSPFLYAQIGFAMFCGWLVFAHIPGWLEMAGICLIVVCGVTASWLTARSLLPARQ